MITLYVCHTRGHGFDSHSHTSGGRNGQPHWLSIPNIESGRIRVSHQGERLHDATLCPI
ncbi:unnamed protein product [Hymenolepis diminuta]|uniref:Uncharacterized protein n=1 Tax=Hymenolepis diminuta TaxID=6216 RepID=A0A564YQN0_HYMDI|nr:unnamed protein product [Hymenolepis diminuta]